MRDRAVYNEAHFSTVALKPQRRDAGSTSGADRASQVPRAARHTAAKSSKVREIICRGNFLTFTKRELISCLMVTRVHEHKL